MKLHCSNCQQVIQIDDTKIPDGVFKVKCPKCGKVVTGQKDAPAAASSSHNLSAGVSAADELQAAYETQSRGASNPPSEDHGNGNGPTDVHSLIKQEIGHLRKEIFSSLGSLFGQGKTWHPEKHGMTDVEDDDFNKKALICEDDAAFREIISTALKHLGYSIESAATTAESLKKIESHTYNLITVDYNFPDDKEGGIKIIGKINGQKPNIRRQTFVVLISANVKSADASAAFFHGANVTVNKEDIRHLEHLIRDGQRRFNELYRVFNRMVEEKNEKL